MSSDSLDPNKGASSVGMPSPSEKSLPKGADLQHPVNFDAVVAKEREQRKLTFGPNSKKIKRPNNILIDIYGVISSWGFAATLRQYARQNIADYVRTNWDSKLVKTAVARLREQVVIDRAAGSEVPEILPPGGDEKEVIESAARSVHWQLEHKHATTKTQIDRLCGDLWSQSYDNGKLKTHAYPEVSDAFQYWRFEEFIKIYSYASGAVEGQRQFLRASELGDLNRFIANGLNSSGGYKFDPSKFRSVTAALREPKPENLLYLTDDPRKARSAIQVGMRAIVVNRTGTATGKYDPKETEGLTVINSLSEIEFIDDPDLVPNCC